MARIFQRGKMENTIPLPASSAGAPKEVSMNRIVLIAVVGLIGLSPLAYSQRVPRAGTAPGGPIGPPRMNAPTSRPPTTLPGERIGPSNTGPGRRVGPPTVRKARRVGPRSVNRGRRIGPPAAPLGTQARPLQTPGRRVGPPTTPVR